MNKTLIAVLVCAVLAMTASAAVVDLTPANFDEVIKGNTYAFVEFFAPWYALRRAVCNVLYAGRDFERD